MVELCANSNHPMIITTPLADTKADIMAMANAFRAASVRHDKTCPPDYNEYEYECESRLSTFDLRLQH
jgi:hypothetical protein